MVFQNEGIGVMLNFLEQAGFFSLVLPFLFLLVLVYALLKKSKMFEDKKINLYTAIVIGLMGALANASCISSMMAWFGLFAGVFLVVLILLGLFIAKESNLYKVIMVYLIDASFIAIIYQSQTACGIVPWVFWTIAIVLTIGKTIYLLATWSGKKENKKSLRPEKPEPAGVD